MTTARCPACGAALAEGAPWCTLCYADLRAPAAPPAPTSATPPTPATSGPRHAASSGPKHSAAAAPKVTAAVPTSTLPVPVPSSTLDLLDPKLDAPVASAAAAARGPALWPCLTCGASNELENDVCAQCGAAFLSGAEPATAIDLPLIGRFRPLEASKGSRAWVMIGGGLFICVVLVVLLSLVGLFL